MPSIGHFHVPPVRNPVFTFALYTFTSGLPHPPRNSPQEGGWPPQLISQMSMLRGPKVTWMVGGQAEIRYHTPGTQPQAHPTASATAPQSRVSGAWGQEVKMRPGVSAHPPLAGTRPFGSPVCCAQCAGGRSWEAGSYLQRW